MIKKILHHKLFKYSIIFFLLLFVSTFTTVFGNDEVWNYGFIKNIHDGLIPYKDFNMVITPFYPIMMSIPMHIFGTNEIVIQIISVLFLTISLFLAEQLVEEKLYLLLLFLVFPLSLAFPSYNIFLFELLIVILYCNKYVKNNDYLLGILVSIMFLTKQHVGVFLFIVLILSVIKDKKRVFKRIISFVIPIIICFIYLLVNNAFKDFIDQCVLGLFTFGGNNKRFDIIGVIFIIEFLFLLYFIKKNPKKIENYYILAFQSMALPMIDLYHTQITNLVFIIVLFLNVNISKKVLKNISIFSIAIIIASQIIVFKDLERPLTYPNKIHHFEYRFISNTALNKTKEVNDYLKKHNNAILLVSNAYYFKIINDIKIERIDLLNYGNSGYNGTKNNINYIKKNKDSLFIIDESDLKTKGQYDQEVLKYVVDNGKKIDTVGEYSVYSFE